MSTHVLLQLHQVQANNPQHHQHADILFCASLPDITDMPPGCAIPLLPLWTPCQPPQSARRGMLLPAAPATSYAESEQRAARFQCRQAVAREEAAAACAHLEANPPSPPFTRANLNLAFYMQGVFPPPSSLGSPAEAPPLTLPIAVEPMSDIVSNEIIARGASACAQRALPFAPPPYPAPASMNAVCHSHRLLSPHVATSRHRQSSVTAPISRPAPIICPAPAGVRRSSR